MQKNHEFPVPEQELLLLIVFVMGGPKKAWYYERQAREAKARETYFANREVPESATITPRGASQTLYYRSLLQLQGTEHLIYSVQVPTATLALLSASDAGLKNTLATTEIALRLRGSGVRPTRLHWYRGSANPVRRRTAWGTSVARYYDSTGGRSHYSIPFSRATGNFGPDDLTEAFNGLFGASGSKRALLGEQNGRAYISWERATVSAQT